MKCIDLKGFTYDVLLIKDDKIYIKRQNKSYVGDSSSIGKSIFILTCKQCSVYRRGDCIGENELCNLFVQVPKMDFDMLRTNNYRHYYSDDDYSNDDDYSWFYNDLLFY
jgi:hypothetical protein